MASYRFQITLDGFLLLNMKRTAISILMIGETEKVETWKTRFSETKSCWVCLTRSLDWYDTALDLLRGLVLLIHGLSLSYLLMAIVLCMNKQVGYTWLSSDCSTLCFIDNALCCLLSHFKNNHPDDKLRPTLYLSALNAHLLVSLWTDGHRKDKKCNIQSTSAPAVSSTCRHCPIQPPSSLLPTWYKNMLEVYLVNLSFHTAGRSRPSGQVTLVQFSEIHLLLGALMLCPSPQLVQPLDFRLSVKLLLFEQNLVDGRSHGSTQLQIQQRL